MCNRSLLAIALQISSHRYTQPSRAEQFVDVVGSRRVSRYLPSRGGELSASRLHAKAGCSTRFANSHSCTLRLLRPSTTPSQNPVGVVFRRFEGTTTTHLLETHTNTTEHRRFSTTRRHGGKGMIQRNQESTTTTIHNTDHGIYA